MVLNAAFTPSNCLACSSSRKASIWCLPSVGNELAVMLGYSLTQAQIRTCEGKNEANKLGFLHHLRPSFLSLFLEEVLRVFIQICGV